MKRGFLPILLVLLTINGCNVNNSILEKNGNFVSDNDYELEGLCSGSDNCDKFCWEYSLYCEKYCLEHPENILCQERFSFLYNGEVPDDSKSRRSFLSIPENEIREVEILLWVEDSIVQPVPSKASKTRLTLPVSINDFNISIGAFGAHLGGHTEGLDHEWIFLNDNLLIGSWADGEVKLVHRVKPNDPNSEYRIVIYYGDGLWGEHMAVKKPLVKEGDKVKAGQAVAIGLSTSPGYQFAEFNVVDQHRKDGVRNYNIKPGVFVSPFDYLRDDVKKEFVDKFIKEVIDPYISKGIAYGNVQLWDPYLTNKLLLHKEHKNELIGEWLLKSNKWETDDKPDFITMLPTNKFYNKQKIFLFDEKTDSLLEGDWAADYKNYKVIIKITNDDQPIYYGIFQINETNERALLKLELQKEDYPREFSDKANIYIERDNIGRRNDAYNLGVYDSSIAKL